MSDLFISYSRKDGAFVRELAQALEARGKDLWVDVDDIGPAAPWREEIRGAIEGSDAFVFVLSPDSLASVECGHELEQAVALSKRIVPVVRVPPAADGVPSELARLNWVRMRADDDFDAGVASLVEAIEVDLPWVRAHTRLGERAEEWQAHDRSGAYLLHGSDLAEAEALLTGAAGKDPAPSANQLAYVAAGRASARRRQRLLLGSVTLALVVAVVLVVVALHERSTAVTASHRALSRQLAADAEVQLGNDSELSVLLASRAYDVDPTAESVATLRHALVTDRLRMRVHPSDGVSAALLTPDGRTLVTLGRADHVVRLWSYPSGASVGALAGVSADPEQLAVNPADGRVVVASGGRAVVFSGTTQQLAVGADVTAVGWSPAGDVFLDGTSDGRVEVRDGKTGEVVGHAYGLDAPVESVAESADHGFVAAASKTQVLLVDFRAAQVQTSLSSISPGCSRLLFSPDGSRLLSYRDSTCESMLFRTDDHSVVKGYPGYAAEAAAFEPESTQLAVGGEVGAVADARTGDETGQYLGHTGPINGLAFVATSGQVNDDYVASAGQDGRIQVWEASNPATTDLTLRADASGFASLSSASGGRLLVSVDLDHSTARVWADPKPTDVSRVFDASHPDATVGDASLSPDGRQLLTREHSGLAVYDVGSADPIRTFSDSRLPYPGQFTTAATSGLLAGGSVAYEVGPDGVSAWKVRDGSALPGLRFAAPAADDSSPVVLPAVHGSRVGVASGGVVELVDLASGKAVAKAPSSSTVLAVSPDGRRLAYAAGSEVTVLSPGAAARHVDAGAAVGRLAFSGDGSGLAVAGGSSVWEYDAATGRPRGPAVSVPGAEVSSLALDAGGDEVAAGFGDGRARVWSVASGRLLTTADETNVPDAATGIDHVQLSGHGDFLLTSIGNDDTELWDVGDGVQLYVYPAAAAGWSDDARTVLTLAPLVANVWDCTVCVAGPALRSLAGHTVTRSLTAAERARFGAG